MLQHAVSHFRQHSISIQTDNLVLNDKQRAYLVLPPEVKFSPLEVTFVVSGVFQRGQL